MRSISIKTVFTVAALSALAAAPAAAQVLDPFYAPFYTLTSHGAVPGVPLPYGGLTFAADDGNILLIGGSANSTIADIYRIRISRDAESHMLGFDCGGSTFFADANGVTGGIDGGLAYGPGDVLFYTTYSDNHLGQIRPGSTGPDRLIALSTVGVAPSTGTLQFVPAGIPGAGKLKVISWSASRWYSLVVTPDGAGTYDVAPDSPPVDLFIGGGPEGLVFIEAGNPGFPVASVLVCEWSAGRVVSYEIDGNGDPIPATQRPFITGLSGAEGAAIDPVTGDFLFSTFGGGNQIIRVSGFTSIEPCTGDINLDGVVNLTDLALLLATFGGPGAGDLNADCITDLSDLALLLGNFGRTC
ncbi:MAG: hypothetical protein IT450_07795 [Phycisphaerales bacterium]|nr:hypothetical protein [Phycisphaerales bacterium]